MCNVYLVVAILLKSMNFNIYPDAVPYLSDFLILIYLFYSKHDSVLFYNISKLLHYNPQHISMHWAQNIPYLFLLSVIFCAAYSLNYQNTHIYKILFYYIALLK